MDGQGASRAIVQNTVDNRQATKWSTETFFANNSNGMQSTARRNVESNEFHLKLSN
jgi:hypothetical protein